MGSGRLCPPRRPHGRAGRKGLAFTLVSGREIYKLQAIERFTRSRIRRGNVPTMDEVEQKRAGGVLDKVRERLTTGRFKPQDAMVEQLLEEGHSSTDIASALFHELLAASGFEPDLRGQPMTNTKPAPKPVAIAKQERAAAEFVREDEIVPESKPAKPAVAPKPVKPAEPKAPAGDLAPAAEGAAPAAAAVKPVEKPAPASKPKPAPAPAAKPVLKTIEPLDAEEEEDIKFLEEEFGRPAPVRESRFEKTAGKPEGKSTKGAHEMVTLPAAARGFQWVRIGVGKNQGFGPREIVDLLANGALNFPPQAVGQIKLMEDQTFCQIHSTHSKTLVADMEGAEHEGHQLKVSFAARGPGSFGPGGEGRPPRPGGKGFDREGPPRSGPGKPQWKKKP